MKKLISILFIITTLSIIAKDEIDKLSLPFPAELLKIIQFVIVPSQKDNPPP